LLDLIPFQIFSVSFDLHFDLVSIHPFADGNGRVSRLMMNYILVYYDQSPAIINKADRNQYFKSLEESREIEDNTPMRKFMYEQQTKEFERQIEKHLSSNKGRFLTFLS
jgi:Fic family protein